MKHLVEPGDTLSSIARQHGFTTHKVLKAHPENAALMKARPNPNVLNPGDEVFVPELETKTVDAATGQKHVFAAAGEQLVLRVKVLDLNREQLHDTCFFQDEFQTTIMPEKGEAYEASINPRVRAARMRLTPANPDNPPVLVDLDVGGLNTADNAQGQQDRLNNLGYFAGFSRTSIVTNQFTWAVEEFQVDHKLSVDGVCGPATQKELVKRHGV
jgi:peptidoglycan hydrolase-like protein with peptidoglycan-binding domain